MCKKILLENLDKIHTTEMGVKRIQKNLEITQDAVEYCISKIKREETSVVKKGKNYYAKVDGCVITINSSSFTIITAHKIT